MNDITSIAKSLFAPGKGLLAADESVHTAVKRLASYGIATSPEMRRQFRELFFGAPDIEKYLSGVILFSDTLLAKGDDGVLFPQALLDKGVAPGIKVDLGTEPMAHSPEEFITQGLLDLKERLAEYKKSCVVFTKWRAVIKIDGDALPSAEAIHENAKRLASYAKEVQSAGMVPMLEPEVLLLGNHSRARAQAVITETLGVLFSVLEETGVDFSGLIIKTAMALSGSESGRRDTPEEVAEATLEALTQSVPKDVAGIVFLSGGQSPDQATANLSAISRLAKERSAPWPLTFSYARALQEEALVLWGGKAENVSRAREAFLARLVKVSSALAGN